MSVNIYDKQGDKLTQVAGNATGGGSINIDNALSSTSANPVQNQVVTNAINTLNSDLETHKIDTDIHVTAMEKSAWDNKAELADIPTELPANGGNADTLGGLNAPKFCQNLGVIKSGNIKDIALSLNHAGGFGIIGNAVTDMPLNNNTYWYVSIERGNTSYARITATAIATNETYVMTYNSAKTTWTSWTPIAFQGLGIISSVDIREYVRDINTNSGGIVFLSNDISGMPFDGSFWIAYITGGGTGNRLITATNIATNKTYSMTYNSGTQVWTEWEILGTGNNNIPLHLHELDKKAYTPTSAYFDFDMNTGTVTTLKTETCIVSGGGIHISIDFRSIQYKVDYLANAEYYGVHYDSVNNILHFVPNKMTNFNYFFLGFIYKDIGTSDCLIPHTINSIYYCHPKRHGRKSASIISRPVNGVTIKPTIDWTNRKLIFNTDGLLISTENGYVAMGGTSGIYEIPFNNTTYNFLVGSENGLSFISAANFVEIAQAYAKTDIFYFGYLHEISKGYEFNFEVNECKTLSVLGDSISTFAGYIPDNVPSANIYYKGTNAGVTNVHKMWWQIVCDKLGYIRNTINAYGGSRVTNTNALGEATTGVSRATALDNGTDPDIIIIYLGVNDFNGGVALGDYVGKGVIPEDITQFGAAYAKMLHNIQGKYKRAKIYCMTLPATGANTADLGYPEANSAGLYQSEFNERIRDIARAYNCGIIEGESCGITTQNASLTMDDYNSETGWFIHPNSIGQQMLAEAVIKAL